MTYAIDEPEDRAEKRLSLIAAEAAVEVIVSRIPHLVDVVLQCFAGQRIPKGTATKRAIRNGHIREQAARGRTAAELAMAFNLSTGQIKRILKQHEHRNR